MHIKNLNRRSLLRAAGVAVGLPLLDSMVPARTLFAASSAAAATTPPVRLAWVFFPNGTNSSEWLPEADANSSWSPSKSLEAIAPFKQHVTAFRGLAQMNGFALGDGPGDHARSSASFLTGAHPMKTTGSQIKVGRSIDQILADTYGQSTRLASIELGTEGGRQAGDCDSGYACTYSNNISWRSENQPTGKEVDPGAAFKRLFGSTAALAGNINASVLDQILDSQKSLSKQVGVSDRQKLDQYFTSIREVEKRIERLKLPVDLSGIDYPDFTAKYADTTEHIRLMYDLMVLAFRTDTTRIATFMLANEGSNRTFPMIDVPDSHHSISHHQNQQDKMSKIAAIDRYYSEQFAYFLARLKEVSDGDGKTLLDNSMIVYGGSISDGNKHDHNNLPVVLAGHGGGAIKGGQLRKAADDTPLNNLFLSMAATCGTQVENFGDSTAALSLS